MEAPVFIESSFSWRSGSPCGAAAKQTLQCHWDTRSSCSDSAVADSVRLVFKIPESNGRVVSSPIRGRTRENYTESQLLFVLAPYAVFFGHSLLGRWISITRHNTYSRSYRRTAKQVGDCLTWEWVW